MTSKELRGDFQTAIDLTWNYARPLLQEGRGGFDLPHTQSAEHWVGEFGSLHKLSLMDLQTGKVAAILHDIGYHQHLDGDISYEAVESRKSGHMKTGAEMVRQLFQTNDAIRSQLTEEQREEIIRLVRIHDDIPAVVSSNDQLARILMEADTMGAIDIDRGVVPTYKGEEVFNYLRTTITKRLVHFQTKGAREKYHELRKKFVEYVLNRDCVDWFSSQREEVRKEFA